ncbi:MAG TPA: hypothetical protein VGB07_11690 [Blastocatellia bacterium]|jgi:chromosome segregation ATPase
MAAPGLEKFENLLDKIHRSVAICNSLRHEKEQLEGDLQKLTLDLAAEKTDNEKLKSQIEFLLEEREAMKLKVEGILDAITMLELEADSVKK